MALSITVAQNVVPTVASFSALPDPSTVASGVPYYTTDAGQVFSNGTNWLKSTEWTYPGMGPTFSAAIQNMALVEDANFGSSATPSGSPVGIAITNLTALGTYYNPLEATSVSGAWLTSINSEIQRYNIAFDGTNHIFDSNGLRLQAVLAAGHTWTISVIGQVDTTNGININTPGGSTTTPISQLGLITTAGLTVGQVGCVQASTGLFFISALVTDTTVTLEQITMGNGNIKTNGAIFFLPCYYAKITVNVVDGVDTVLNFSAVPAGVQTGMFTQGVRAIGINPAASDRSTVVSTTSTTVTLSAPIRTGQSLTTGNNAGIVFIPNATSGQIWSKHSYGPHLAGSSAVAMEASIKFPTQPSATGVQLAQYTKSAIATLNSTYPGLLWGMWPAFWLYSWRPNGVIAGARQFGTEIDIYEPVISIASGPNTWTGNSHDQQYTRKITNRTGTWETTSAGSQLLTANASALDFSTSLFDGAFHKFQLVWTKNKLVRYVDGVPICEDDWSVDTDYPMQVGINLACGALSAGPVNNGRVPQTDANLTGQSVTIGSFRSWIVP